MFREGAGHLEHDLGAPPHYGNATVLLSEGVENFRYFGSPCPVQHKKMFPRLRDEIERLRRGHRVNHDLKLYAELVCLKEQLWKVHSPIASTPIPSQPDGRCDCQDDAVECGG